MYRFVLPDILEMHIYRILDIHFYKLSPKASDEADRIVISTIRRTKSRHRNSCNLLTVSSKQIKRPYRNKQCQCGIQTSGNSNDRACAGMLQTFLKSHRLNHQYLITPLISIIFISGNKRCRINISGQLRFFLLKFEHDLGIIVIRYKSRHSAPLSHKLFDINLCVDHSVPKSLGFSKHTPIFRNHIVSRENQILC